MPGKSKCLDKIPKTHLLATFQPPPPNISPIVHTLKVDTRRRFVSSGRRILQGGATSNYTEDAPTCRDQLPILQSGSGMENLHTLNAVGVCYAGDRYAGTIFAGVASGCERQTHSVAGMPEIV